MSAFGSMRQEDCSKFKASLGNIVGSRAAWTTKGNHLWGEKKDYRNWFKANQWKEEESETETVKFCITDF